MNSLTKPRFNAVQCYPYNAAEVCEPREEDSVITGDFDCVISQFCSCIKGSVIAEYIFEIGPLLYPFSIEFRDLSYGEFSLADNLIYLKHYYI